MSTVTMRSDPRAKSSDPVPEHADALDLELDHVPALQPATVAVFENAAGADGPRAEHVAGSEVRVARSLRDDRLPRVVHVGELAARPLLAVHARNHRPA